MQNYDLNSLNKQQLDALYQTEGAVLVTAGAGSGKTRLLTHRIAYLINQKQVSSHNILAITFTNKAANEMLERTQEMLGGNVSPWISTFHSMCARILRVHIEKLGYRSSFSIYSDSDADKLIDQILLEKNLQEQKKDLKKAISFHISNCKNNNIPIDQYALHNQTVDDIDKIMEVFYEYEKRMFNASALDFDDLLGKTYKLLTEHEDVRNYYSNRFKYILVDEFQDTNTLQYELVKLLCQNHKNIFVVGDEDQCIYSWRGASYHNIAKFIKDFNAKVFKLETNYRSTPNILQVANQLIKNNTSRIDKTLKAVNQSGNEPEYYTGYSEQDEANYIASKISFLTQEKGYTFSDFAILMRVNSLSLSFEQTLLSYNIPHKIFGGFKFFERAETKLVLSYLKLFTNPDDEVAFLRVINLPKRGLGNVAINNLKNLASSLNKGLLETVLEINLHTFPTSAKAKFFEFGQIFKAVKQMQNQLSLGEFAKYVVDKFEIKNMFNTQIDEELYKVMNIDTLLANIQEFNNKNPEATLEQYLEGVTLSSDIDDMDQSEVVTIATVHAVKGLEFKVVFVVGLEEGLFPIKRAFGSKNDLEEERRLMYVAVTRAQQRLYLTNTKTRFMYGKRDLSVESRFVKELGFENKLASKVTENYAPSQNLSFDIADFKMQTFGAGKSSNQASKGQKDISVYKQGQTVQHTRYGKGQILSISGGDAEIKFEVFGVKTLILALAPLEILS